MFIATSDHDGQAGGKIKDQTAFFVVTRLQEWSVTVDVRHRAQKNTKSASLTSGPTNKV